VAERYRRGVEPARQRLAGVRAVELDRQRRGRVGEDADLRLVHLHPARRLRVRDGDALDLEHRLRPEAL
jgi:hypothetical protein